MVQVEVPRAHPFQRDLRPEQLLVLQLQLDLVHAQLVEQALGFLRRGGCAGLRLHGHQPHLCATPQLIGTLLGRFGWHE